MDRSGFFNDDVKAKRDKSGTLWVECDSEVDGWRKHRFILQDKILYHYPSDRGVRGSVLLRTLANHSLAGTQHSAKRAIPLKFATIEHDSEQEEIGLCIFQITTPLISYVIKAKHQVDALWGLGSSPINRTYSLLGIYGGVD
jgi:hypothetical protein